jgi:catechol 2,3-dioxygenase-like lactoylglutathione lyase family enzyme
MALLVNIDVADLDAATDFYTRGLGLRVGRRLGGSGVELLGLEAPVYLLAKPSGSLPFDGAIARRDYQRHWTPVHLDFAVEDIEAAVDRAMAAGATREGHIETHAWGKIALMADPFGHGFCFVQFVGAGYDAIAAPSR